MKLCDYLQNEELTVNNRHSDKAGFNLSSVSPADTAVPLCAPRVRIERKLFPHISDQPSVSTTSSTATSDSRDFIDVLHADNFHQAADSSKRTSFGARASASSTDDQTPVQLTPKEAPSPLTPFLPSVPPNSPRFSGSHVDPAAFSVTLPRCKKDSQKIFTGSDQTNAFGCYGPTMTIDRKCKTHPRPVPPVPPVRRLPSWVLICIVSLYCLHTLCCTTYNFTSSIGGTIVGKFLFNYLTCLCHITDTTKLQS